MALQPGRADWLYLAHWDDAIGGQDMIGTESIADALTKFAPIARNWLALDTACTRIAFGSNISQPTADKVAGYKLLAEYLPAVSLDPEKTFDFNYQINRARVSTVIDDLRINRLTKWSVIKFVQARVDISSASPQVFPFGTPSYSVQLELDMNTAEDRTVRLDSGRMGALLDELQGLAFEIAEQGDIP